jgi:transcriptional regulator with XRE-family HTH domain
MDLRELRNIRLRRGLSQADLSAMTGVAEYTISEIEAGKRPSPRPSTLRKLAHGLGVEVADLYGESEYPLGEAPPTPQPSLDDVLEEERRASEELAFRTLLENLIVEGELLEEKLKLPIDYLPIGENYRFQTSSTSVGKLLARNEPVSAQIRGLWESVGELGTRIDRLFGQLEDKVLTAEQQRELEKIKRRRAEVQAGMDLDEEAKHGAESADAS